jgi:hypothetical protein
MKSWWIRMRGISGVYRFLLETSWKVKLGRRFEDNIKIEQKNRLEGR